MCRNAWFLNSPASLLRETEEKPQAGGRSTATQHPGLWFLLPAGATVRSGRVHKDSDTALLVVEGIWKIAGAIMVSH